MAKSAGYSGTPLLGKLGVMPGTTIVAVGAPREYTDLLGPLPLGAKITTRVPKAPEFVHVFATSRTALATHLRQLRTCIAPNGVVWVSWPKKTSGVTTDITEDTIRQVCLPLGFVDIKVCAVDDTWSGLKLVLRKELRPKK